MGIRSRFVAVAVACGVFLILASRVHAGVATLELSSGADVIVVSPGEAFSIDVVLEAPEGVTHNSSLFSLIFTQPGLIFESYSWAAPYENETVFDFSSPLWSELPQPVVPGLNPGPASEVMLSNVVASGWFGSGVLVTLSLRVPGDWTEQSGIGIAVIPDSFADGFEMIEVVGGDGVLVSVVPSVGGAWVLLCSGIVQSARRRRRAQIASRGHRCFTGAAHGVVGCPFASANCSSTRLGFAGGGQS